MADKEIALLEKNGGDAAYKRKSYDTAISHYSNAMRLDPTEMTHIYHIAKTHLKKKNYAECITFCTRAIKVGKEQKANVKMVAKAMAMRGKAHKKRGEMEKFKEDIEKAMNFLKTIAEVKFRKERWEECMEFCLLAQGIGQENELVDSAHWDPELMELSGKAFEKYKQGPGADTIKRQAEVLKLEIQGYNPDMDLKDISVEYNSDTKEFVANINHKGGHGEVRFKDVGLGRLVAQDNPNMI